MDVKEIDRLRNIVFKTIFPKIDTEEINKLLSNRMAVVINEIHIKELIQKNNIKTELTPYDIANTLYYQSKNEIQNYLSERNTRDKLNEVRELSHKEKLDIKVGDFVSHRGSGLKFTKGKVVEVKEDTFILTNKNKEKIEIPRNFTVKMFPGQKFDAREIEYNLIDLKISKKMNNAIDLNNVFKNFNLNSRILTFSDLTKANRIKLIKGEETDVISFLTKVKQGDNYVSKVNKIRLKAFRYKGKINLQTIKGFTTNIYGETIKSQDLEKLKAGEILIYKNLTTTDNKKFNVAAFWDKGLEQVRVKTLNDKPLEKLTVLGNYVLNKKEIKQLNSSGEITVNKTLKNGENHNYKITYNKPLNEHKVFKIKKDEIKKQDNKQNKEIAKKNIKKPKKRKPNIS